MPALSLIPDPAPAKRKAGVWVRETAFAHAFMELRRRFGRRDKLLQLRHARAALGSTLERLLQCYKVASARRIAAENGARRAQT